MKKVSFWSVVWGLLFIAAAGLIVLHLFGMLGNLSTWTLLVSIPIAAGIIASIIKLWWSGIFMLSAVMVLIYRADIEELLGITIEFWPLVGIAVFLSIGFHILFRKRRHNYFDVNVRSDGQGKYIPTDYSHNYAEPEVETAAGEKLWFSKKFGASSKYINSDNLSYVNIYNSFAGMDVYFDNAKLAPEGAVAEIYNEFGGLELYIPRTWNVVDNIETNFAAGIDLHKSPWIDGAPTLTLRGSNKFGGIDIKRV